jgi:hypothetical protein
LKSWMVPALDLQKIYSQLFGLEFELRCVKAIPTSPQAAKVLATKQTCVTVIGMTNFWECDVGP